MLRAMLLTGIFAAAVAASQPARILFPEVPERTWGDSEKVPVHRTVEIEIPGVTEGKGVRLTLTGSGLREKKVVLFDVDVYYALSYVSGKWDPASPQASLASSPYRLLQLFLLRDLSADQIRSSFQDSLKANGVNLEDPAIAALLKQMRFDVKAGTTVSLVGYRKGDKQGVIYQLPQGNFRVEGANIADAFWSIWFGKTTDGNLERLKRELVSGGATSG